MPLWPLSSCAQLPAQNCFVPTQTLKGWLAAGFVGPSLVVLSANLCCPRMQTCRCTWKPPCVSYQAQALPPFHAAWWLWTLSVGAWSSGFVLVTSLGIRVLETCFHPDHAASPLLSGAESTQ